MKNKYKIVIGISVLSALGIGSLWKWQSEKSLLTSKGGEKNLSDLALLSLIKNDQKSFESVVEAGVKLEDKLPLIDGKSFSIAEGIVYFERPNFIRYLQGRKKAFIKQVKGNEYDILTIAVSKNNPEILNLLVDEKPHMNLRYGKKELSLLHLASIHCSYKLMDTLSKNGLKWSDRNKEGKTALTLAAENECLPILSYWKDQKADFKRADGRGINTISILKMKKGAAFTAFVESFESRKIASSDSAPAKEISFYRKRKIPKDQIVDHAALIEPEARPLEATETAEFSEFAD